MAVGGGRGNITVCVFVLVVACVCVGGGGVGDWGNYTQADSICFSSGLTPSPIRELLFSSFPIQGRCRRKGHRGSYLSHSPHPIHIPLKATTFLKYATVHCIDP